MVPYFLSQHPLSTRGKSISKVKGQPGGIPFVLSATPYVFSPVCMCFSNESVCISLSLCVHKKIWSHQFIELSIAGLLPVVFTSLSSYSMSKHLFRKQKVK